MRDCQPLVEAPTNIRRVFKRGFRILEIGGKVTELGRAYAAAPTPSASQ